ncbi:MAG TPA: CsbD family protein [Solirubrobacterales bacterium]|nr:CsbD family protein [Solirubrobacterales bacterium]
MSDEIRNTDDAKGRVKEAAGNLTGDKDLQREGKVDQAGGKAKEGVEKITDKIKHALKRD